MGGADPAVGPAMILRYIAVAAIVFIMPSLMGIAVAGVTLLLMPRVLRALPTARSRERAQANKAAAILLAEALAAHLAAGVPLLEALDSCATAEIGELREATRACAQLIRTGSHDPFAPWQRWSALSPLARELSRALRLGSGTARAAQRGADRMREEDHRRRRLEVERVGIRITIPVALCLLPAFLLLAVLPPAIGILEQVNISSTSSP